MFFKFEFLVQSMPIGGDEPLEFKYPQEHNLAVRLWRPSAQEQSTGHKSDDALGEAVFEQEPDSEIKAMFESLAAGILPPDSNLSAGWLGSEYDDEGHILGNHAVPLRVMPQSFQEFAQEVADRLRDYAFRTVRVLRWRSGAAGFHNPFSHRNLLWSLDGETWLGMPHTLHIHVSDSTYSPRTDERTRNDVITLVGGGQTEPLGHELFREAWEQVGANPRSALVVGMAALETGVKQCIAALAPDAQWLIENLQSPPVVRLLSDYLPTLNMLPSKTSAVPYPAKHLRKAISDGVELRNEIVHGKPVVFDRSNLERILNGVDDILWILDFACGHSWALDYVTTETRADLKQRGM